jgi:hypothetical protein
MEWPEREEGIAPFLLAGGDHFAVGHPVANHHGLTIRPADLPSIRTTILPNRRFLRRFLSVSIRVHPWFIHLSLVAATLLRVPQCSIGAGCEMESF